MPGIPPKPPRPNGDCAGSGGGAPLWSQSVRNSSESQDGEPCRWCCGRSWRGSSSGGSCSSSTSLLNNQVHSHPILVGKCTSHSDLRIFLHLDVVRSQGFLVFHNLASKDEAKIFNRSPRKFGRNCLLELKGNLGYNLCKMELLQQCDRGENKSSSYLHRCTPVLWLPPAQSPLPASPWGSSPAPSSSRFPGWREHLNKQPKTVRLVSMS